MIHRHAASGFVTFATIAIVGLLAWEFRGFEHRLGEVSSHYVEVLRMSGRAPFSIAVTVTCLGNPDCSFGGTAKGNTAQEAVNNARALADALKALGESVCPDCREWRTTYTPPPR